jgi:signal transduction histidine kinase
LESKNTRKLYGARIESQDDLVVVERLLVLRPVVIRYLLIAGLLSIILASVSILFYSHRIAGPMYRLHKHLQDMIKGDYKERLRFRKNDEFKHLADAINKIQDKLMENNKFLK